MLYRYKYMLQIYVILFHEKKHTIITDLTAVFHGGPAGLLINQAEWQLCINFR